MTRAKTAHRRAVAEDPPETNSKIVKNKMKTYNSANDFLYKLLTELYNIVTTLDIKTIQAALHELSNTNKKSPILMAVSSSAVNSISSVASSPNASNNDTATMEDSTAPNSSDLCDSILTKQQSIGYWIVLATHTLQRLLTISHLTNRINADDDSKPYTNDEIEPRIVVIAWISYFLSAILATAKVEKFTSSSSPGSRQVFGRALLACTAGAAHALKALTTKNKRRTAVSSSSTSTPDDSESLRTSISDRQHAYALQVCILALDNAILPNTSTGSSSANLTSSTPTASPGSLSGSGTASINSTSSVTSTPIVQCQSQQISVMWNHFKVVVKQQFQNIINLEIVTSALIENDDWFDELKCLEAILRATTSSDSSSATTPLTFREGKSIKQNGEQIESESRPISVNTARNLRRKKPARKGSSSKKKTDSSMLSHSEIDDTARSEFSLFTLNHLVQQVLLSSSHSQVRLDGRLAIKRWTAVALTWYCHGHKTLLYAALALLKKPASENSPTETSFTPWMNYMDVGFHEKYPTTMESTSKECMEHYADDDSRKSQNNEGNIQFVSVEETLPGNVTILWIVGRLIRLAREVGTLAGSKPPSSGGLDSYMNSIFDSGSDRPSITVSALSGTKKTKKRQRMSVHSGGGILFRTNELSEFPCNQMDIRDLGMVVSYYLIQSHYEALKNNIPNFMVRGKGKRLVVNDDSEVKAVRKYAGIPNSSVHFLSTNYFGATNTVSVDTVQLKSKRYYCYPFIHKAIEELARTAATTTVLAFSANMSGPVVSGMNSRGHGSRSVVSGISNTLALTERQNRWCECIEYASAAYILEAQSRIFEDVSFDARLVQFAIAKLNSCMSTLINNSTMLRNDRKSSLMHIIESGASTGSTSHFLNVDSSPTDSVLNLLKDYNIDQPLPVPMLEQSRIVVNDSLVTVPSAGRRRKVSSVVATQAQEIDESNTTQQIDSTFGGVYSSCQIPQPQLTSAPSTSNFPNEEVLSMLLRAFHVDAGSPDDQNTPKQVEHLFSSLLSHLMTIIECCFDTRSVELLTDLNMHDTANIKKSKRNPDSEAASNRKSKRQRKGGRRVNLSPDFTADMSSDLNDSVDRTMEEANELGVSIPYRPIEGIRSMIASEALDSIQLFLRMPNATTGTSFRAFVDTSIMNRIIDLAPVFGEIIVHPNQGYVADVPPLTNVTTFPLSSAKEDTAKLSKATYTEPSRCNSEKHITSSLSDHGTSVLSHEVKLLWTSYFNVCITLGRGHVSYSGEVKTEILDHKRRESIFLKIMETSDVGVLKKSTNLSNREDLLRWPLCLSPGHRLVVLANLSSEPSSSPAPDQLIVNGFVSELIFVLGSLTAPEQPKSMHFSVSEDIPLSLHDTRIFLLAFSRLGYAEKSFALQSLLHAVEQAFQKTKEDFVLIFDSDNGNRDEHSTFLSSFLARVVTMCVNAYIMLKFEPHARDELFRVVGKTISAQLPTVRSQSDWYYAERCFTGVFSDWEDSDLPNILFTSMQSCDTTAEETLERILETALSVGLSTAIYDKCQLVFAAWNGLGKRELWNEKPVAFIEADLSLLEDSSVLLLQLRDEMCLAHRLVCRARRISTSNAFLRILEDRETRDLNKKKTHKEWAAEVKSILHAMIVKASCLIESILDQYVPYDESIERTVPSGILCLLEALVVYISFAISSHTEPKNDFFSTTLALMSNRAKSNRARAYSSDSENNIASDAGSVETQDALVDAIERVQDVCESLGAVPSHPDWLDSECSLSVGISFKEASEAAEKALRVLTKLVGVGLNHSDLLRFRTLSKCSDICDDGSFDTETQNRQIELASKLCWIHNYQVGESTFDENPYTRGERNFGCDIASLCNIEIKVVDAMLSEFAKRHRHAAKRRWCPHSAQHILGNFQNLFKGQIVNEVESPELRSGGEWEVLLSGALTSASIHVDVDTSSQSPSYVKTFTDISNIERWCVVCCAAIDSMIPSAALLRYGLSSGGRKMHPLRSIDTMVESFESNRSAIVEDFQSTLGGHSTQLKELVSNSLCVIARFPPHPTCQALASHLMINSESFHILQGMEASATALQILSELQEISQGKSMDFAKEVSSFVVERVVAVLESYGGNFEAVGGRRNVRDDQQNTSVMFCLWPEGSLMIDTFLVENVDAQYALRQALYVDRTFSEGSKSFARRWRWEGYNEHFIHFGLVSYIWCDCEYTNMRTRAFFVRTVSCLAISEYNNDTHKAQNLRTRWQYLSSIVESFNTASESKISDLIANDVICITNLLGTFQPKKSVSGNIQNQLIQDNDVRREMQERLCEVFCLLQTARSQSGETKTFNHSNLVLKTLTEKESFGKWTQLDNVEQRKRILNLTVLYSCRNKNLGYVGSLFMNEIQSGLTGNVSSRKTGLENATFFFDFVFELKSLLSNRSGAVSGVEAPLCRSPNLLLPGTCSFARKSDFHEQHWYNCYTCGLIDDKGCCSLCALVCHQGHDVTYARYSSFFCDCGAPYNKISSASKKQVDCKCLTKQPHDQLMSKVLTGQRRDSSYRLRQSIVLTSRACADIVKSALYAEGKSALQDFGEIGLRSQWVRLLMKNAKDSLEVWKVNLNDISVNTFLRKENSHSYDSLRIKLNNRFDTFPTITKQLEQDELIFLGATPSATFEMKITSDSASDRAKRNMLGNKGVSRFALAGDSRGRLAIAEAGSLVFCSLLPLLNSKTISGPNDASFQRSSLCAISTALNEFGVVGLRFSQDYEKHLAVWGMEEAKVLLMNDKLSDVDHCVYLEVGLSGTVDTTNECIINCHWLTGSKGLLVVGSCHSLKFFDLSRPVSNIGNINPIKVVSHGSCDVFRDFVIVPGQILNHSTKSWNILVLLNNGRLHEISVLLSDKSLIVTESPSEAPIQVDGELKLDKARSLSIMSRSGGAVRTNEKSVVAKLLSAVRDPRLVFLKQSRLLIYQADSTYVVGLLLDNDGRIKGTFGIFTYEIQAELLGRHDKKGVTGPYTHWTELGIVRHGHSIFFRMSCCGKCLTSGDPVFLCIDFNEKKTLIQELKRNPTDLGAESTQSVDGACAFSFPCTSDDPDELNLDGLREFNEKVAFCILTSSGSLHLYTESGLLCSKPKTLEALTSVDNCTTQTSEKKNKESAVAEESFLPLLAFERLSNVSDSPDFAFEGVGFGSSSSIREKLIGDSDLFLMGPRRENFTLTISNRIGKEFYSSRSLVSSSQDKRASCRDLVAVRIHVGSRSLDSIPVMISVEGRVKELTPGLKKWYSFPLTAQEVALSIRNGFLTVEVGKAHEANSNPVIDAMELFAVDRVKIERWLPTTLESIVPLENLTSQKGIVDQSEDYDKTVFRISLIALGQVTSLLGPFQASKEEILFVKQLVQDTALHKDNLIDTAVQKLVESLYSDKDSRQSFHDKAVLLGCSTFLRNCQITLEGSLHDFQDKWNSLSSSLRICLQTSANIARHRAYNYLQAADETPQAFGSIATDASKFLVDSFTRSQSNDNLVSDFVELSLLEIAVAIGSRSTSEYSPRGRFGSLDGLRHLLNSTNTSVISDACISISRFCQRYSVASSLDDGEVDLFTAQTMEVKYACDSCTQFIEDVRYTLLDDDHPFDLCTDCYCLAKNFSSTNLNGPNCSVIVGDKVVGDGPTLTCGEVEMMKAVDIKKSIVVQRKQGRDVAETQHSRSGDDAYYLLSETNDQVEIKQRQQLFDDFMDGLFVEITGLLEERLNEKNDISHSLIKLLVDLVRYSVHSERKIERAKRLAEAISFGLKSLLGLDVSFSDIKKNTHESNMSSVIVFLEALSNLVVPDRAAQKYLTGQQMHCVSADVPTNQANTICEHHKAPTMLMKFSEGEYEDKEFYVCSLSDKVRCNYFAWAGSSSTKSNDEHVESLCKEDVAAFIWKLLSSNTSGESLHVHLRAVIEQLINNMNVLASNEVLEIGMSNSAMMPISSEMEAFDFYDGIYCSRCRMQDLSPDDVSFRFNRARQHRTNDSSGLAVIKRSLELLSLVAGPESSDRSKWFPVLCRIMITGSEHVSVDKDIKTLAKRTLEQFCGKKKWLAEAICDHFTFCFRIEELLNCTKGILEHCVLLNEKARQCGTCWRTSSPISWRSLSISNIVGMTHLVSEDISTILTNELVATILCDLLLIASKRGENWRRFCSMRILRQAALNSGESLLEYFSSPPVFILFALATSVNNDNQLMLLKLINIALNRTSAKEKRTEQNFDETNLLNLTDDIDNDGPEGSREALSLLGIQCFTPEEILNASIDDIYTFVLHFLCNGATSEVRSVASKAALKFCEYLEQSSIGTLLKRLMGASLSGIGPMGKCSLEFLALLQLILKMPGATYIDVSSAADRVQKLLRQQILAVRHDRANTDFISLETRSSTSIHRKRFEFSSCVNCCSLPPKLKEKYIEKSTHPTGEKVPSSTRTSTVRSSSTRTKWLPEQVSPFSRGRLDTGRDTCTSNEFCSFFSLKHRYAISAVHLQVNDPRGRFVKSIKIYCSPRPVGKPSALKSADFDHNWQPCGEINLARGASRATCILAVNGKSTPIIAAALKIEYADFYERPGSSKNSDGSLVVHCPRCTRVVTNAHGVCSNCGEVAFQCRKCRHINYDGLDAFLCVECGYCASGAFHYGITAGFASNAIVATCDRDYERLTHMSSIASRLHENIRDALQSKLVALIRRKKGNVSEDDANIDLGCSTLNRAFRGYIPAQLEEGQVDIEHSRLINSQLGKCGSVIKLIGQSEDQVGDRTQSLFRIARQIRGESSSARRSADSLMIRHLGRNLDDDESASEFLGGLLEGSGTLSRFAVLDPSDPLSRLLASVQSRRERREAEERRDDQSLTGRAGTARKPLQSSKEALDECERLHMLMREAELEFYELDRRCKAWVRLERGCLGEVESAVGDFDLYFEASHCSNCGGHIALQLVTLWLHIFQLAPNEVHITNELISLLLNVDSTGALKNLQDIKHLAVKEIALCSDSGSPLVLDALRMRLHAFQDTNSAEIVGKILQADVENHSLTAPFAVLAREALEAFDY